MRERRLLWLAAATLLGLGVGTILLSAQRLRSGITRKNFDRIQEGMTEEEVEEILSDPPGIYTDRPIIVPMSGTMFRLWWIGDEGVLTIELTLDQPRRVSHKEFDSIPPESFAERCRRRYRWLPWLLPVAVAIE